MSKTFKTAKKPSKLSPDQISAYESSGAGHDHKPTNQGIPIPSNDGNREPTNELSSQTTDPQSHSEPTKRLSLDLPETVHRRFKTACSATDTKMVAEIIRYIEQRTGELESQAGISHKNS